MSHHLRKYLDLISAPQVAELVLSNITRRLIHLNPQSLWFSLSILPFFLYVLPLVVCYQLLASLDHNHLNGNNDRRFNLLHMQICTANVPSPPPLLNVLAVVCRCLTLQFHLQAVFCVFTSHLLLWFCRIVLFNIQYCRSLRLVMANS